MTNRRSAPKMTLEPAPREAVIRRKETPAPQGAAIERKLQADVAAWLRERRSTR